MFFLIVAWGLALLVCSTAMIYRFRPLSRSDNAETKLRFYFLGFLVVFAGSVFGYEFFHIPAPIPITSDRALLAGMGAVFAFLLLRGKTSLNNLVMLDVTVIGITGVILASAVTHDWSYNNNLPISRFLFFYLMPVVLYFIIRNVDSSSNEMSWIAIGMTIFGCYLAVTGIFEVKEIHALVFPRYILNPGLTEFLGRARGPFLNPISNGIFLTTSLASAMALLWQANSAKSKVIWMIAIGVLVAGNVATLTRSVWLSMALAMGFVGWVTTDRRQKAVLMIGGICVALLLAVSLGNNLINFKRDKHVSKTEMAQSAQLRPIFAVIAWEMFKDRPVFGHGFGQYGKRKIPYLHQPSKGYELARAKPYLQHNVFLSLLTELGAIGCGLLVLLIFRGYQISIQILCHTSSPAVAKMYALILIALLTSYAINGLFHDTSIIPMANMLLFFVLAMVVSQHQQLGLASELIQFDRRLTVVDQPAIGDRGIA